MNQRVIVDFSRVEEALRLSSRERELVTARERTKNAARLIKYATAGLALIIVSSGIAWWLAKEMKIVRVQATTPVPIQWPTSVSSNGPSNKVVTNLNLFNSISKSDLNFHNPYFLNLNAGHRYSNSNADTWDAAWCYANFEKDLMKFKVDLVNRSRTSTAPAFVSQRELRELRLTDADVAFLRSHCPWRG